MCFAPGMTDTLSVCNTSVQRAADKPRRTRRSHEIRGARPGNNLRPSEGESAPKEYAYAACTCPRSVAFTLFQSRLNDEGTETKSKAYCIQITSLVWQNSMPNYFYEAQQRSVLIHSKRMQVFLQMLLGGCCPVQHSIAFKKNLSQRTAVSKTGL